MWVCWPPTRQLNKAAGGAFSILTPPAFRLRQAVLAAEFPHAQPRHRNCLGPLLFHRNLWAAPRRDRISFHIDTARFPIASGGACGRIPSCTTPPSQLPWASSLSSQPLGSSAPRSDLFPY